MAYHFEKETLNTNSKSIGKRNESCQVFRCSVQRLAFKLMLIYSVHKANMKWSESSISRSCESDGGILCSFEGCRFIHSSDTKKRVRRVQILHRSDYAIEG